jgi:hypothetical protein
MTLQARVARLEMGPRGIRRLIIAICGKQDEHASLLADRGIVGNSADLVIVVRKPGSCAARVTVDGLQV